MLLLLSISAYLMASLLLVREVRGSQNSDADTGHSIATFATAIAAAGLHFAHATSNGDISLPLNVSLSAMSSLISLFLVACFLVGCLIMPIKRLGLLVLPMCALSLLFSAWWSSPSNYISDSGVAFNSHLLVSILAYSVLSLAAVQAILFYYQERLIKSRTQSALLFALPPLQTMEQLLFKMVGFGFILLSAALLSGAIFSQQIFGQAVIFKHHTILALLGWVVFAVLLYKRARSGLRGSQAVIWTVSGFVLIQLGYFGTKIVSESLNIQ